MMILNKIHWVLLLIESSIGILSNSSKVKKGLLSLTDKVPIDFFVMSKCTDAIKCENDFSQVVKQLGEVLNLSLDFIETKNDTLPKDAQCLHGREECLGNIQELCAKKINPYNWYDFVLCLNLEALYIGSKNTTQLNKCLSQTSIPVPIFNRCVKEEGPQLQRESFLFSKQMNISTSCTILINKGQFKCTYDEKKSLCSNGFTIKDFNKKICETYQSNQVPEVCKKVLL